MAREIMPENIEERLISKDQPNASLTIMVKDLFRDIHSVLKTHGLRYDEMMLDEVTIPLEGPQTLQQYIKFLFNNTDQANFLFRKNNETITMNDTRFIPLGRGNLILECVRPGKTGNESPDFSGLIANSYIQDGEILWIVVDIRYGRSQVGDDFFKKWTNTQKGYKVQNGSVLTNVSVDYPMLVDYLMENTEWTKTAAEWTALSNVAGGVGGVPYFVYDSNADTIKLPDMRDMYIRASGTNAVGLFHGDAIRNITGTLDVAPVASGSQSGVLKIKGSMHGGGTTYVQNGYGIEFNASLQVPTADENRTKAVMYLPVIYIGGEY